MESFVATVYPDYFGARFRVPFSGELKKGCRLLLWTYKWVTQPAMPY